MPPLSRPGAPGPPPRYTVVCGGLGGARCALALQAAGLEDRAAFVTNVGDDLEVAGALVCPDTDAVLYALAGCFDEERGWGVRGDVFPAPGPGGDDVSAWFHVGRRDRALHERRTAMLRTGLGLGAAVGRLAGDLGVRARVLPVTDDRVRTAVVTAHGRRAWQEWLVRDRARPRPVAVDYEGAPSARPGPGVLAALRDAAVVVLAPSSPVGSLEPVLAVPGVVAALRARRGPTVAVSPVVARRPPACDRDRHRAHARAALLAAAGCAHTPPAVAARYAGFVAGIGTFVLDAADAEDAGAVRAVGLDAVVVPDTTSVEGLGALVRYLEVAIGPAGDGSLPSRV